MPVHLTPMPNQTIHLELCRQGRTPYNPAEIRGNLQNKVTAHNEGIKGFLSRTPRANQQTVIRYSQVSLNGFIRCRNSVNRALIGVSQVDVEFHLQPIVLRYSRRLG